MSHEMLVLPIEKELELVKTISRIVCKATNVDLDILLSRRRGSYRERFAKYAIIYFCCKYTSLSQFEVSQILRVDISTLQYGIRSIKYEAIEHDTSFTDIFNSIEKVLEHRRFQRG